MSASKEALWKTSEFRKSFLEFIEETKTHGPCDKCGEAVDSWNNVALFVWLSHAGTDWMSPLYTNRHLEPVADEHGVIICPGSPSRWQMIGGFPDERSEYKRDFSDPSVANDLFWAKAIWSYMQTLKPATQEGLPLHSEASR